MRDICRTCCMPERWWSGAALVCFAGVAAGQNSWFFDIQYSDPAGVIDSPDDTATISLWAAWDAKYYAFDMAKLDVIADDPIDSGEWLESRTVLRGPGSGDGTIEGDRVAGIIPSQLQFPGTFFADTSNPILVWHGTWSTSALHARDIPINTESRAFRLWTDFEGDSDSFIDMLTEGFGTIQVVPAPAVAPPLILAAALGWRRR